MSERPDHASLRPVCSERPGGDGPLSPRDLDDPRREEGVRAEELALWIALQDVVRAAGGAVDAELGGELLESVRRDARVEIAIRAVSFPALVPVAELRVSAEPPDPEVCVRSLGSGSRAPASDPSLAVAAFRDLAAQGDLLTTVEVLGDAGAR